MRRYNRDQRIAGRKRQTAKAVRNIRRAQLFGLIKTYQIVSQESQRLDILAEEYLGSSQDWWILAALSNIGWCMQIPPGTIINVPRDVSIIQQLVG